MKLKETKKDLHYYPVYFTRGYPIEIAFANTQATGQIKSTEIIFSPIKKLFSELNNVSSG